MKFRVVWTVVVAVLEVVVVVAVLQVGVTKFERVALAAIVLAYVSLRANVLQLYIGVLTESGLSVERFMVLARPLNDPGFEDYRQRFEEDQATMRRNQPLTMIYRVAIVSEFAIGVWFLVSALLA